MNFSSLNRIDEMLWCKVNFLALVSYYKSLKFFNAYYQQMKFRQKENIYIVLFTTKHFIIMKKIQNLQWWMLENILLI